VPGPVGIAINPETNVVYMKVSDAAGWGSGYPTLTALDGASGSVVSTTILPYNSHAYSLGHLAANSSTGDLYVSNDRWQVTALRDRVPAVTTTPVSSPTSADKTVTVDTTTAQITFTAVAQPGETTVTPIDATTAPVQPTNEFAISGSLAYEVETTAAVTFPVTLCFNVASVTSPDAFSNLHVLHGEDGVWVDRTTSRDYASGTICGTVTSLSPFTIAPSLAPPPPGTSQIADLIAAVTDANPTLGHGLGPDLTTKLTEAVRFLTAGRKDNALFKLGEFEAAIQRELAKKEPKLTTVQASSLLATLARIRVALAR